MCLTDEILHNLQILKLIRQFCNVLKALLIEIKLKIWGSNPSHEIKTSLMFLCAIFRELWSENISETCVCFTCLVALQDSLLKGLQRAKLFSHICTCTLSHYQQWLVALNLISSRDNAILLKLIGPSSWSQIHALSVNCAQSARTLRQHISTRRGREPTLLVFLAELAGGRWKNACPGCAWLTGPTGVSIAHIPHFPPHIIVLQISRPLLAVLLSLFLHCM